MSDDRNGKKDADTTDYEVGYGKPPKHTRWKKGQPSPNPKGRPKGTRNLKTDLLDELGEKIILREGGRSLTTSKQRTMVKVLAEKALKGDIRAINVLVNLLLRFQEQDPELPETEDLTAADAAILEAFLRRNRAQKTGGQSDE